MALQDVVMGEVAKAITASLAGAGIAGAGRLLRLVRRRTDRPATDLPTEIGELQDYLIRRAQDDPGWAERLALALPDTMVVASREGVGPAFLPPVPFCDRGKLRDGLPENGIRVFAGPRGCGKTALVQQLAVDHAVRFPTYYRAGVDLDEFRMGDVLRIAEVKRHLLRQLGITDIAVADPELSRQYQRVPLFRRSLLVLENARGADELTTLVENWPAALVLVTTRRLTEDLRVRFPQWIELDGLDEAGARALLASWCPEWLIDRERVAADTLLTRFGRQPHAIQLLGAILSQRTDEPTPIAGLLADFEHVGIRETDGLLGAVLSGQVGQVPEGIQEAFRLLALCPAGQFTVATASVLLDCSAHRARMVVGQLRELGLVEVARGRFRMSWSIRRFAAELGAPAGGETALDRLLAYYTDRAVAADLADGDRMRYYRMRQADPWPDGEDRIDWLDIETEVLAGLVEHAYRHGRDDEVGQLCGALELLSLYRGRYELCLAAFERGVLAARRQNESRLLARQHALCGRMATLLHRFDRARAELDAARTVAAALPEPALTASIWEFIGRLAEEEAGVGSMPDWQLAVEAFTNAVEIDRRGDEFGRARGLHARMLANVMVKAGRAREAGALLEEANIFTRDDRNASRLYTVWAKCHVIQGDLPEAREKLRRAQEFASRAGSDQYRVELDDLTAEIEYREGDIGRARSRWAAIAQDYVEQGHPRAMTFFAKLSWAPPGS